MNRLSLPLVGLLALTSVTLYGQTASEGRLRKELMEVQAITNDLVREAQRDAEVLGLLVQANRALDDWQKNNALAEAMERVTKAQKLIGRPPMAHPKVRQAVRVARELIEPAQESPTTADLQKLRDEMSRRPISWMREVVAEEMHALAMASTQLADVSSLLSKAIAGASAAVIGRAVE